MISNVQKKQRLASDPGKAESFADILRVVTSTYRLGLMGVDHEVVRSIDDYLRALNFQGALKVSKRALSERGIKNIAIEIAHIADERGMYDEAVAALRKNLRQVGAAEAVIKHIELMRETRGRSCFGVTPTNSARSAGRPLL